MKSVVFQALGQGSENEVLAEEAYKGFLAGLGPNNLRTLFAYIGYLTAKAPQPLCNEPGERELLGAAAREFAMIVGPEAAITRHVQCLSKISSLNSQDPDVAIREYRTMLEDCESVGTFSPDTRVPILDEPTLRIVLQLGNAKISYYAKRKEEVPPPVELLTEARELGERALQGCEQVMPMFAASASRLICFAYALQGNTSETRRWFDKTCQLFQDDGGSVPTLYGLEDIAQWLGITP